MAPSLHALNVGQIAKRLDRKLRRLDEANHEAQRINPAVNDALTDRQKITAYEELLAKYDDIKTRISDLLTAIPAERTAWLNGIETNIPDEEEQELQRVDYRNSLPAEENCVAEAEAALEGAKGRITALINLRDAATQRVMQENLNKQRARAQRDDRRRTVFNQPPPGGGRDDNERDDNASQHDDENASQHADDQNEDEERSIFGSRHDEDGRGEDGRGGDRRDEDREEDHNVGSNRGSRGSRTPAPPPRPLPRGFGRPSGAFNMTRGSDSDVNASLPKIELIPFSGNFRDWQPFWQLYDALVHSKPIPKITKLQYLMQQLRGEAKASVDGFQLSEENYDVIIGTLKRRFGDSETLIRNLHQELKDVPIVVRGAGLKEVRNVSEAIQRVCRSLEAIGESTENQQIRNEIESKLPQWLLTEVYPHKTANEKASPAYKWSTKDLRNVVKEIVALREKVSIVHNPQQLRSKSPRTTPSDPPYRRNYKSPRRYNDYKTPEPHNFGPLTGAFAAVNQPPFQVKCVFCQAAHLSRQCDQYKTVTERRNRVQELELCFSCLKPSHMARNCPDVRPCRICNSTSHHTLVCARADGRGRTMSRSRSRERPPFRRSSQSKSPGRRPDGRSGTPGARGARKQVVFQGREVISSVQAATTALTDTEDDGYEYNYDPPAYEESPNEEAVAWGISSPVVIQALSKDETSYEGSVHLLTKSVTVRNPSNPAISSTETVFADSGSMLSLVEDSFARKIGLGPFGQRTLRLITLHSTVPTSYEATIYEVDMRLANGTYKRLRLYSKQDLVGRVIAVEPRQSSNGAWELSYYETEPTILLGSDVIWDLDICKIDKLANGATIFNSEIGPMAAGRIRSDQSCKSQAACMSVSTPVIVATLKATPLPDNCSEVSAAFLCAPLRVKSVEKVFKKSLDEQVEVHFALESAGITDCAVTTDTEYAIASFQKSVNYREQELRYYMSLIWKPGHINLPTNFWYCFKRLQSDEA